MFKVTSVKTVCTKESSFGQSVIALQLFCSLQRLVGGHWKAIFILKARANTCLAPTINYTAIPSCYTCRVLFASSKKLFFFLNPCPERPKAEICVTKAMCVYG